MKEKLRIVTIGVLALIASVSMVLGCKQSTSTQQPEACKVAFSVLGENGTLTATPAGGAETATSPLTVEKGKTVEFTAKPKDSGYEVEKWTVSGGKLEAQGQPGDTTAKVKVTAETTVTVTFKPKTVPVEKITVTVQGDEQVTVQEPKSFQVDKGAVWKTVKTNVKVMYKDGYELSHWQVGSKDGTVLTDEYAFTENTAVFAVSKLQGSITYTVKHLQEQLDGSYKEAEREIKNGTTGANTEAVAKAYPGFTVHTVTPQLKGDGSIVIEIKYNRKAITLTLNLNGGTGIPAELKGKFGAQVEKPANPTKEGYTFSAWNPELPTMFPAENKTYTATWATEGDYSITYNLDGGINDSANPASYNVKTGTITLKDATKTGYTFKGWFEKSGYSGSPVTQIEKGSTGNKEFWAKWEANTYTVVFDVNGSTDSMPNQQFTYDKEQDLTVNTLTKNGYTFVNWNTNKDGKGTAYTDKQPVKNLTVKQNGTVTLYAQWQINTYSVTYNLDDGINDSANPPSYNVETPTITLEPATRSGYTFKGWFEKSDYSGSPVTQIEKGSTGNKEFWAKWQKVYKVTFEAAGGNGELKAKVKGPESEIDSGGLVGYGKTVVFTAEPVDGYAVEQWTLNGTEVSVSDISTIYEYSVTAETDIKVRFIKKEAGLIVLANGIFKHMDNYTTIDSQNPPVAVIAGNLNGKHLGIALHTSNNTLQWAKHRSIGYEKRLKDIICTPNTRGKGAAERAMFDGDTDGSDNWKYIKSIDHAGTEGANAETNYSAFNWVAQYNTTYTDKLGAGTFDWYMPSLAELCEVYKNREAINASLTKIHDKNPDYADASLGEYWYWSSSQGSEGYNSVHYAWFVYFGDGYVDNNYKSNCNKVCCIAVF